MANPRELTVHYNGNLLNLIPVTATRVLDIGCGTGGLGNRVKARNPDVVYDGIEIYPPAAQIATQNIDHVYCINVETDVLPLEKGSYDCIVYGDVLEHLYHPVETLEKLKPFLKPDGFALCCLPNAQNHQIIASLLCGDFQYQDGGLMDRTHIRFFTYANAIKLLLDAGMIPELLGFTPDPENMPDHPAFARYTAESRDGMLAALEACVPHLQQDPVRFKRYLSAFQFIFKGTANRSYDETLPDPFPISFVVPTDNPRILGDYLLMSPIFPWDTPHQVIRVSGQSSAAAALEEGLKQAVHEVVVFVHQDVYLPTHWDRLFCQRLREIEARDRSYGLVGVQGASKRGRQALLSGRIVDRQMTFLHPDPLPAVVDTVDDCLFAFRKSHYPGMDSRLGWYLYGADLACRFRQRQQAVYAVDAPCYHNSRRGLQEPPAYVESSRLLASNWQSELPMVTPRMIIGGQ
ncbi:MAG: methyltransferase domain-containing protein [Magnetococcales bacterium]|nr:methyltransferase domain-containing protein [Magnetococcales bacterium]